MKKKILNLAVRIIFSIAIVVFLLSNADIMATFHSLAKTDHKIWFLCVVLYLVGQVLSAYKWKLLASAIEFKKTFRQYVDYYFVGMFFNLFLPTTVGGDVAKCFYLSKGDERNRKAPAVYSVLAERYTGVIVIAWLATIALFSPIGHVVPFQIKMFMLLCSLSVFVVTPLFPKFFMKFFKKKKWVRIMLKDIRIYWDYPSIMLKALGWSLIFHLLIIFIHVLMGHAMGLKIPMLYYFIVYPMASIAGFVPFTFNGIGPREGTYVYFFTLIGISSAQALAFGIFWFGIVLCASLVGGIFYIKGKHVPPPEEFEIEDDAVLEDSESENLIGE